MVLSGIFFQNKQGNTLGIKGYGSISEERLRVGQMRLQTKRKPHVCI